MSKEKEKKEPLKNITKEFITSFTTPIPRALDNLREHSLEQLIGRQAFVHLKHIDELQKIEKEKTNEKVRLTHKVLEELKEKLPRVYESVLVQAFIHYTKGQGLVVIHNIILDDEKSLGYLTDMTMTQSIPESFTAEEFTDLIDEQNKMYHFREWIRKLNEDFVEKGDDKK